jgi:hypothetical protein
MRNKLFLFLIISNLFYFTSDYSNADETTEYPVFENINWKVDGSVTPVHLNVTESFTFIKKILIHLSWTDNTWDINEFAGETALSNGVNIHIDGDQLFPHNITTNIDFGHFTDDGDVELKVDDKNPKSNSICASISLTRFMTTGVYINGISTFGIVVFDNITNVANLDDAHADISGFYDSEYLVEEGEATTIGETKNQFNIVDALMHDWLDELIILVLFGLGIFAFWKWWID